MDELIFIGFVSRDILNGDKNLHYGPFSQDWWKTRCTNNTTNSPGLYSIRINIKTLVILQNTHFFITVIQGHTGFLQQSEYICEAEDLKSAIFNNPSGIVTTLYQQLFKSGTRFSGPLIMGHDKIEIGEQLLKDVNFCPFCCFIGKFWLFVYGVGISSNEQSYYASPGFKSSFFYSIGVKKERTLFVQEINKKNATRKVGILQEYRDVDIFGISHPQIQTFIQTLLIPKYLLEEWHIVNKMQALWNYHLQKYTLASIQWNEFFNEWYRFLHPFPGQYYGDGDIFWNYFHQALEANKKGYNGKRRILSIIAKKFSYNILMEKLKVAHQGSILEARKYARINGPGCVVIEKPIRKVKRITSKQKQQFDSFFQNKTHIIMSNQYIYREDLEGLCFTCSTYGYETFEDITNLIKEKINNVELQREYEEHLVITDREVISHDPCINHYLLYAFGECNTSHTCICNECQEDGGLLVVDYKMKVLPKTACETKQEFFGKKGWALHTVLLYTKSKDSVEINIQVIDHWST
ncbi:hypothetical protein C1646_774114 [Rhizophagus diaphanus]|nr:hypothetical protein C1646_774114 [Rhizophagus diaphanus] [Rhizophagus sp. MUCL 43196]